MSTAPPFEMHRAMSTTALDFDGIDSYSMLNGDEWSNFDTASDESQRYIDFDYSHPAGPGVGRKHHIDTSLSKNYEPETPMRKVRGNSFSPLSGLVTPQSVGRSFSCTSLPYTPSIDHALPSPMETPLGTPLDNPMYNPFEISCDSKMAGWDFSASGNALGSSLHSGSNISPPSLIQNEDIHGGALSASRESGSSSSNGSISISTKPASALLSRRAARSSSISSTDSRKLSINGRHSSVSSGINPFYCPPPCLRESPREGNITRGNDLSSESTSGIESTPNPSYSNSIQAAAAAAAAAFSTFGSTSDIDSHNFTVDEDAGISPTEGNTGLYYGSLADHDPVFRHSASSEVLPDMLHSSSTNSSDLHIRSRSASVPSPSSSLSAPQPDKPFICEACNKGFRRMEHLRRHTKTHTQERPYTCTIPDCGRKFSRTDNLKAHILTHAKKTGRNTYVEGLAEMQQVKSQKKRKPKRPEGHNSD